MAEERDIEKQLRAAAEHRRLEAGAPFELHPATRRLLQDEVRRAHPRPDGAVERNSLFANWWFRMAVGACVVAVVASIFLPPLSKSKTKSRRLAQNSEWRVNKIAGPAQNQTATPYRENAPAPAEAPPSTRDETDKDRPVTTREVALNDVAAKSSALSVTNGIVPGFSAGTVTLAFASQSAQQNFYFRNASVPPGTSWGARPVSGQAGETLAKSDLKRSLDDQAKAVGDKIPLATFQMEQTGNQIRITDSDGSVYNGDLTVAKTETPVTVGAVEEPAPAAMPAKEPEKQFGRLADRNEKLSVPNQVAEQNQNFRFKATGTNLSLNQKITISGEFIAATNLVDLLAVTQRSGSGGSGGGGGGGGGESGLVSQSMVNQSQRLSNGRIVGKVVLGNGQEIPLNATPAAP